MKLSQSNKFSPGLFSKLIFGILLWIMSVSGIYRDDTGLQKYIEFSKDSVFNSVGEVYSRSGKFRLSCVLVHERFLLSSAHGFYEESRKKISDTITVFNKVRTFKRPETSWLVNCSDIRVKLSGSWYDVKQLLVHPGYSDDYHADGFNDIILIELTEPVLHVTPALLYTDTLEKGARGIVCGYGEATIASDKGLSIFSTRRKMAGENRIDSLGGNVINSSWGAMFADMDHPDFPECNRMGDALPLPLEWHGEGGDCGGGLFIQQNGQWRLAGISFVPSYYKDWETFGKKYGNYGFIDGWTRISPLCGWINSIVRN